MPKKQQDKVLTALAGEYYVAAELCRRGYVASLTLKNYPKVDIFALDPATQRQTTIQVKTTRGGRSRPFFFVPENAGDLGGVFVFVVLPIGSAEGYEVFIVPAGEVERRSVAGRTQYIESRPGVSLVQPLMFGGTDLDEFKDNWQAVFSPMASHLG